jgi:2-hydroxychromene-2-carboxylate isomerase
MPRQVDYYFSLQSPSAYIGHQFFRDLVSAYDLTVNHKPVVLVDLFSETDGRWRRDRGDRGRPGSRALFAPRLCRRLGRSAQSRRSRDDRETRR